MCGCSTKIAFGKHWIAHIRSIISKCNRYFYIAPWCSCDKRFNWIGFYVILMLLLCLNLISCFYCIILKMLYLIWIWTEKKNGKSTCKHRFPSLLRFFMSIHRIIKRNDVLPFSLKILQKKKFIYGFKNISIFHSDSIFTSCFFVN